MRAGERGIVEMPLAVTWNTSLNIFQSVVKEIFWSFLSLYWTSVSLPSNAESWRESANFLYCCASLKLLKPLFLDKVMMTHVSRNRAVYQHFIFLKQPFHCISKLCSLVFTDSEEKLIFVFFAQIGHEKSILNILHISNFCQHFKQSCFSLNQTLCSISVRS